MTDPSTYTHRHPHPLINQIPLYLIVIVVLVAVIIIDPNIDYCCPRDFIEHCYSDVMWLDLSHSFPIYWYAAYTVAHVILSFVSLPVCVELDATHKKRRDRRRGRRRGSWVTTMWPHQLLLYAVGRNEEGGEGQEQGARIREGGVAHNVTGDNPLVCRKREGGREQGMNKHMHGQRCEEGAHTHAPPDSAEQIYSSPLPAASRREPDAKHKATPNPAAQVPFIIPLSACVALSLCHNSVCVLAGVHCS